MMLKGVALIHEAQRLRLVEIHCPATYFTSEPRWEAFWHTNLVDRSNDQKFGVSREWRCSNNGLFFGRVWHLLLCFRSMVNI
jgi:hypothetical protein